MNIEETAQSNFESHLTQNPYPGRGLVLGKSDGDTWLMIYWIMGRSTNSRNRRFVVEGQTLRTEPVDLSLVADPSLIIYEAMLDLPGIYLVSNGDQTRTMYETLKAGGSIEAALVTREREPDAPNFTPRISGMLRVENGTVSTVLSILKASAIDSAYSDRYYFRPSMPQAGFGFGLTTYSGDGNPLPSFTGEPLLLPCAGAAKDVLEKYWAALNAENRISLAVKEVSVASGQSQIFVKNRF
jgi:IMP cyclohydrolase